MGPILDPFLTPFLRGPEPVWPVPLNLRVICKGFGPLLARRAQKGVPKRGQKWVKKGSKRVKIGVLAPYFGPLF